MTRKARMIASPPGGTVQLGQHTSMRLLAGSMGAPVQPMPGDEPLTSERFEAPTQDDAAWEQQLRQREMAEGMEAATFVPQPPAPTRFSGISTADPEYYDDPPVRPASITYAPDMMSRPAAPPVRIDLSGLPGTFTLEVEQKPDGTWKITAPGVHVGLFVADRDLGAALSRAPGVLAEIVRLDGVVAKPRTRKVKA